MLISDWSADVCSSDLRSDLEAPHPREVDARVATMPGHDRPVVHLHRQFAPEDPQATEPALQVQVQHRTAGAGAKHLLGDPFDSPALTAARRVGTECVSTCSCRVSTAT